MASKHDYRLNQHQRHRRDRLWPWFPASICSGAPRLSQDCKDTCCKIVVKLHRLYLDILRRSKEDQIESTAIVEYILTKGARRDGQLQHLRIRGCVWCRQMGGEPGDVLGRVAEAEVVHDFACLLV